MRKGKSSILLIVALTMGIAAAWVANNWIKQRVIQGDVAESSRTAVVVAALKIPYGQKIEGAHLKTVLIPNELVKDDVFHETEEVVGKIARHIIFPGETIIKERVADHTEGSTLAVMVEQDMRAVTVRVNDVIGVAGFLLPGNRVDVLASRLVNRRSVTRTVLQNVKVLAVDQTTSTEKDKPVVVRAVTLEVSPRQSEALFKAQEEGNIQLTLRNPIDEVVVNAPEKAVEKKAALKKSVVRKTLGTPSITVIRGTAVNKKKVSS